QTTEQEYRISKWYSLGWGVFCMIAAMFAANIGNSLIEAVNILGSLFYGTILGIFLVGFHGKQLSGNSVFIGALLAEVVVVTMFILSETKVIALGFLWLNAVGAIAVWLFSWIIEAFRKK